MRLRADRLAPRPITRLLSRLFGGLLAGLLGSPLLVVAPGHAGSGGFVDEGGWVGPRTELSGAWDGLLQNCMSVRTSLAEDAFASASESDRRQLVTVHEKFLTQFEHQKRVVAEGCDAAFASLPILAQCRFRMPFAAVRTHHLDEASRSLMERYRDEGAVLFGYKYYNPETALTDPTFEQRCRAIDGDWEAVAVDSEAYREAVALYEAKAPPVAQDEKPPRLDELFQPTD